MTFPLCGDQTCLIREYLGVKNYSGKVEVRVENYFHLDVVSHPNQQILGHWIRDAASVQ